MSMIDHQRWKHAQQEEGLLWAAYGKAFYKSNEVLVHLGKMASVCNFANDVMASRNSQKALEIGIGVHGLSVLASGMERVTIIGVEPLPRLPFSCRDKSLNSYIDVLRSRVKYCQAMGENLPFGDAQFDLVCCHNTIDHTLDPLRVVKEVFRVLKDRGVFVLTVNTFSFLGKVKFEFLRRANPRCPNFVMHPHTFTHKQAATILTEIGFKILKKTGEQGQFFGRSKLSQFLGRK